MPRQRVAVIGAGVAGLVAALDLAARGLDVVVLERAAGPGGKLRALPVGEARVDAGPTVFTMRWVFEEIFAAAGAELAAELPLRPAERLARHAWDGTEGRLDLFADRARTAEAIGAFAGPAEARRYHDFCARAARIFATLDGPFMRQPRPSLPALLRQAAARGPGGLRDLWGIAPFTTLWRALGRHFHDPRLRQLFGRYATYCGGSPYRTPATLMLVAHVEQQGVWLVEGGMHRLAEALARLATARGAVLRHGCEVQDICLTNGRVSGVMLEGGEHLTVDAVVANADVAALADGLLGPAARGAAASVPVARRSLSAVTWQLVAETEGFPLLHHNVFFGADYAGEFDDIFRRRRLPHAPTVYLCAQDRDAGGDSSDGGGADGRSADAERLFCLVNAPPVGDLRAFETAEIESCTDRAFALLRRCGLTVRRRPETTSVTTPNDFARLFPGTGGALYGRAPHGWTASFRRPGARSRIPGLYLAGGSAHPGPGVPMAALSGRLAASCLAADLTSPARSRTAATPGGTSTRSATTEPSG